MSPLDSFWTGVLSLLTPVVTPDWGKLVGLIPLALLLVVLLFLGRLAQSWVGLLSSQPARGPRGRRRPLGPMLIAHLAVIAAGVVVAGIAFITGSQDPAWTGATSPLGLVVNIPLLILGLVVVVGAAGNGARLWEHSSRDEVDPDPVDRLMVVARRHPARTRRVAAFVVGVVLAAVGLGLGHAPGYTGGDAKDAAVIPVLLLGLALAVGAVGSAIAAVWARDPDFDEPSGDEPSAMVAARH